MAGMLASWKVDNLEKSLAELMASMKADEKVLVTVVS